MKVLMLGWELPPHNSGGLGKACYELCKTLAKNNVDIEFILPYDAEHNIDFMKVTPAIPQGVSSIMKSGIAYDSYKYSYADGSEEWVNIYDQHAMYEAAVLKLVDDREFDIVHAHDWLTFRAAVKLKQQKGCPIILHVHSLESDRAGSRFGNPMIHEIEEMAFSIADKIIAISEHTKRCIIRDYGVPENLIEVVHNSIDPEELMVNEGDNVYKYISRLKEQGYRVVISFGRLTIQKGLPNLLQAAKKVIDKVPKTIVLISGNGEQFYELLETSAALGIGANVIFTDWQRGKNLRDVIAIGDLFVMPSISEPFGLTPLESISYGTPALVSKQSGVSEVLNNCLKVDYWDIDEMANQIASVMQNDSLRDELLSRSHDELIKMSWENSSNKIVNLYNTHTAGSVY